jgi:hypothetical protein
MIQNAHPVSKFLEINGELWNQFQVLNMYMHFTVAAVCIFRLRASMPDIVTYSTRIGNAILVLQQKTLLTGFGELELFYIYFLY